MTHPRFKHHMIGTGQNTPFYKGSFDSTSQVFNARADRFKYLAVWIHILPHTDQMARYFQVHLGAPS
jgi:hypothetical protein